MNIKFEKDGVIKETHEKFTDDLIAVGWKVYKEKPIKEEAPVEKKAPKKGLRRGKK